MGNSVSPLSFDCTELHHLTPSTCPERWGWGCKSGWGWSEVDSCRSVSMKCLTSPNSVWNKFNGTKEILLNLCLQRFYSATPVSQSRKLSFGLETVDPNMIISGSLQKVVSEQCVLKMQAEKSFFWLVILLVIWNPERWKLPALDCQWETGTSHGHRVSWLGGCRLYICSRDPVESDLPMAVPGANNTKLSDKRIGSKMLS